MTTLQTTPACRLGAIDFDDFPPVVNSRRGIVPQFIAAIIHDGQPVTKLAAYLEAALNPELAVALLWVSTTGVERALVIPAGEFSAAFLMAKVAELSHLGARARAEIEAERKARLN